MNETIYYILGITTPMEIAGIWLWKRHRSKKFAKDLRVAEDFLAIKKEVYKEREAVAMPEHIPVDDGSYTYLLGPTQGFNEYSPSDLMNRIEGTQISLIDGKQEVK